MYLQVHTNNQKNSIRFHWYIIAGNSYPKKIKFILSLLRPVICQIWHYTQIWKALACLGCQFCPSFYDLLVAFQNFSDVVVFLVIFCFFICLFVCFHFIVACMVVVCFLTTLWPFILAQCFGRMSSLHVWQCVLSTCVAISSGSTQSHQLFHPRMIVCSRSQCGCVFLRHV